MKNIHHSTSGFTLTELLVSISIIGTLLGILLPTLAMAKAKANRIKCVHNVGQVGKALLAFAADNSERMPWQLTPFAKRAHFGSQDPLSTTAIVSLLAMKSELGTAKILASPCDAETQGPNEAAQANWETYGTRTGNRIPLNAITYRFIKGGNTGRPGTMLAMTRNFSTDNLATGSLVGADEEKSHSSAVTGLKKDQGQAVFADGSARQITNQDIKATVKYHQSSCGGFAKGPASTIIIDGGTSDNDLLLYLPFTRTAKDESGNGNHGLPKNLKFEKGGFGPEGMAGRFRNGTAVTLSAKTFPSGNSPRTLSCWVMVKGHIPGGSLCTNTETSICGYGQARWNAIFGLFGDSFNEPSQKSKNGFFAWSQWGDNLGISKREAAEQNKWYMLTTTYDGKTVRTYLNGEFYRERPFHLETDSNSQFIVGQRDWRRYTDGLIDEVRLYGRALSAEEVQALYKADQAQTNHKKK